MYVLCLQGHQEVHVDDDDCGRHAHEGAGVTGGSAREGGGVG